MAIDESEADDGALHRLYATVPPERILFVLLVLHRLARFRGAVTPEVRARAQELADAVDFNLAFHPAVQRILDAP